VTVPPPPERMSESPVVPGRANPLPEFGLQRLRASRLLQACLVVAFICYGALVSLLVAGRIHSHAETAQAEFYLTSLLAMLSLASWGFLFLWFPALERVQRFNARDPKRAWVGRVLEGFAVACVAIVHVLLAITVVHLARA
jgi:hypothetical protein